jgi:hypothetical protein
VSECKDCKFWRGDPKTGIGKCHRYPPKGGTHVYSTDSWEGDMDGVSSSAYWSFPETDSDDWCGEFKEKGSNLVEFDSKRLRT